tara:strand:- start:321 stop:452 length:132 start_codon:yes stop_codon:yes gene_type:complete
MNNFMIKLGETSDGRIIEVPDILLFGVAILFIIIVVSISNTNK